MKRNVLKYASFLLVLSLVVSCFIGCNNSNAKKITGTPRVTMTIKNYGDIVIELYPDKAPITVANFISLVESGYYNNNKIIRCQANFVVQGGDPTGTGSGGSKDTIKGEFSKNGIKNEIAHERGVLSMARSSDYNSASSQFFIVLKTSTSVTSALDGSYAAFGKVISGMEIVDKLVADAKIKTGNTMGFLSELYTIEKAVVNE